MAMFTSFLPLIPNNTIELSASEIDGCINVASDGLAAHMNDPLTQALVHKILYSIAAVLNDNAHCDPAQSKVQQCFTLHIMPINHNKDD